MFDYFWSLFDRYADKQAHKKECARLRKCAEDNESMAYAMALVTLNGPY